MKTLIVLASVLALSAFSMAAPKGHWRCTEGKCVFVPDVEVTAVPVQPTVAAKFMMASDGTVVQMTSSTESTPQEKTQRVLESRTTTLSDGRTRTDTLIEDEFGRRYWQGGHVVSSAPVKAQSDCPTCPNYVAREPASASAPLENITFNTQIGLVNISGGQLLENRAVRMQSWGLVQGQPIRNVMRIVKNAFCR